MKKLEIKGFDSDGPSLDNRFIPSIEVHRSKGERYCIGMSYNGGSSLDPSSYTFDHVVLSTDDDESHDRSLTKDELDKILNEDGTSFENLVRVYTQKICKNNF